MILTNCAACAAPLAHDAPRCVRCHTRYCNKTCQLIAAINHAGTLLDLKRFEEGKSLLRSTVPVARRVLGENHDLTLSMRLIYASALYENESATVAELSEAVTTLDYVAVSHKRLLGDSHPEAGRAQYALERARTKLRARASE